MAPEAQIVRAGSVDMEQQLPYHAVGVGNTLSSPMGAEPVPIISSAQYRFFRFALDVAASLGENGRLAGARSSSLSRVRVALRLFEERPPPR